MFDKLYIKRKYSILLKELDRQQMEYRVYDSFCYILCDHHLSLSKYYYKINQNIIYLLNFFGELYYINYINKFNNLIIYL